ncbi:hypothetical protein [Sodalis praecaptivus]|uniref:hypothetical protein n=1 Tax=Sodalis praecaptivus TaxID=1239307 RepID=UPI00280B2065|nr:hypothetical protein [Sodalis praecaptivus]
MKVISDDGKLLFESLPSMYGHYVDGENIIKAALVEALWQMDRPEPKLRYQMDEINP